MCVCTREREREREIHMYNSHYFSIIIASPNVQVFLWTKGLQSSDPLFWWVSKWNHYSDGWCCYSDGWDPQPPNSSELKTSLMNRQVVVKVSLSYWSFHRRWLTGTLLSLTTKWHGYLLAYRVKFHRHGNSSLNNLTILYEKLKLVGEWVGGFFEGNLLPFIYLTPY